MICSVLFQGAIEALFIFPFNGRLNTALTWTTFPTLRSFREKRKLQLLKHIRKFPQGKKLLFDFLLISLPFFFHPQKGKRFRSQIQMGSTDIQKSTEEVLVQACCPCAFFRLPISQLCCINIVTDMIRKLEQHKNIDGQIRFLPTPGFTEQSYGRDQPVLRFPLPMWLNCALMGAGRPQSQHISTETVSIFHCDHYGKGYCKFQDR